MPTLPGADLYSPFMTATIIDNHGTQYPLWTNINNVGQPLAGGIASFNNSGVTSLPFVTEMTVELNQSYIPIITVTFSPPYTDALKLIDAPMIEWGQSKIQVQFGYSGGAPNGLLLTPVFEGFLLKPDITLGETIEITFHAQGAGGLSAVRQGSQASIKNATVESIIQQLAAGPQGPGNPKRNLTVDFSQAEQDPACKQKLTATRADFQQGGLTDYMGIYTLLMQCGCWSYFTRDKSGNPVLAVTSRANSLKAAPQYTLTYFDMGGFTLDSGDIAKPGTLDPSKGLYPIFAASSQEMALYMAGAMRGLALNDVSSATGKPISAQADDAKTAPTRVGASPAGGTTPAVNQTNPGVNSMTNAGGDTHFGNPERAEKILEANARFANSTALMGIPLNVTCPGIPTIIPGNTVKIKGLGARLEANYGVFKVIHTIGTDGYTTTLDLVGNLSAVIGGTKAKGPVNDDAMTAPAGSTANPTSVGT